jgi:hypothetical protein
MVSPSRGESECGFALTMIRRQYYMTQWELQGLLDVTSCLQMSFFKISRGAWYCTALTYEHADDYELRPHLTCASHYIAR